VCCTVFPCLFNITPLHGVLTYKVSHIPVALKVHVRYAAKQNKIGYFLTSEWLPGYGKAELDTVIGTYVMVLYRQPEWELLS